MAKLVAKNLTKRYKKVEVLHGVSLEVNSGEVVGLLGPNGAGKTTSFYIICGLVGSTSGEVLLDNKDISNLPLHQRAKLGIGYLPQEASIFKDLSVEDNLYIAAEAVNEKQEVLEERVENLLNMFNIEPIRKRIGVNLSGGERRRVEIARSLVCNPKFILLDEPFAGVDPINVSDIQKIIKNLSSLGIGVLITDHSVRETLSIVDKAYVIKSGTVFAEGTKEEIINDKEVQNFYLGENFKI
jgi:lipopolysaccharide export system ATP-binding protein